MNLKHKSLSGLQALAAAALLSLGGTVAYAQDKTITLCWAAWNPANALVELSKDFSAKSGVKMKFEFVLWANFADRMLNELNSKARGVLRKSEAGGRSTSHELDDAPS